MKEKDSHYNSQIMQRELQALFFDFDGVVVDSARTKTEAFRALFHEYSGELIEKIVDHHVQNGGISRVEKIAYVHEYLLGKALTEQELKKWSERYSRLVVKKVIEVDWIAGAEEFFLEGPAEDVKVFLISGTPEEELRHILDVRGMSPLFHERLGSPVKKEVHIRRLLGDYGLDPKACVFIGDALTDYNAARATGLHFVGIQGEVELPADALVLEDCRKLDWAIDQVLG